MKENEIKDLKKTFLFFQNYIFLKSFGFKKKKIFCLFVYLFSSIMTHGSLSGILSCYTTDVVFLDYFMDQPMDYFLDYFPDQPTDHFLDYFRVTDVFLSGLWPRPPLPPFVKEDEQASIRS